MLFYCNSGALTSVCFIFFFTGLIIITAPQTPFVLCFTAQIDVHGDEALPYNFFVSNHGIPGWTPRLAGLETALSEALLAVCPDFQTEHGYPRIPPGKADLRSASKQVWRVFCGGASRERIAMGYHKLLV